MTHRECTQHDIIKTTSSQHSGPGFFQVLGDVCDEAFGGQLDYEPSLHEKQFPMDDLTVGELLDFFAKRGEKVNIRWHNQAGGPQAYVVVADAVAARSFRAHFKIDWLSKKEEERLNEDMGRQL